MALGKKNTAKEVLRDVDLRGKTAIVTGATAGIGTETARALNWAGANVTLAVRQTALAEKLRDDWLALQPQGAGEVRVAKLDLADLGSVRASSRPTVTRRSTSSSAMPA